MPSGCEPAEDPQANFDETLPFNRWIRGICRGTRLAGTSLGRKKSVRTHDEGMRHVPDVPDPVFPRRRPPRPYRREIFDNKVTFDQMITAAHDMLPQAMQDYHFAGRHHQHHQHGPHCRHGGSKTCSRAGPLHQDRAQRTPLPLWQREEIQEMLAASPGTDQHQNPLTGLSDRAANRPQVAERVAQLVRSACPRTDYPAGMTISAPASGARFQAEISVGNVEMERATGTFQLPAAIWHRRSRPPRELIVQKQPAFCR